MSLSVTQVDFTCYDIPMAYVELQISSMEKYKIVAPRCPISHVLVFGHTGNSWQEAVQHHPDAQ
jgi:hypothetical protein